MQLAYELSRRCAALRFEDLPPQAVHWAKLGILDTVGVMVAGSVEPSARILGRVIPPSAGASLVFGSADRTSVLDAALINGTAAHALDFDDCNNTLGGHPSAPILPALFALADERPVDGRAFMTAYVAGFETECKLGLGVNFHHYTKGWHPTATLGVHGAAAAACHLLRLDARRTATALAGATASVSAAARRSGSAAARTARAHAEGSDSQASPSTRRVTARASSLTLLRSAAPSSVRSRVCWISTRRRCA